MNEYKTQILSLANIKFISQVRVIKEKILRWWIYPLLCFLFIYPCIATVRLTILDKNLKRSRINRRDYFLYGHWHEDIPLLSCRFGFSNFCTMASFSRDGQVITNFLKMLRYRVVRGTSFRGWKEAFDEMSKAFREGWNLVLAVDGPKGPRHEVKPGIVYLASKEKIQIVPVAAAATPKFILHKSWDKMWFPYPFSKATIVIGDPVVIEEISSRENAQRMCKELQNQLIDLKQKAIRFCQT